MKKCPTLNPTSCDISCVTSCNIRIYHLSYAENNIIICLQGGKQSAVNPAFVDTWSSDEDNWRQKLKNAKQSFSTALVRIMFAKWSVIPWSSKSTFRCILTPGVSSFIHVQLPLFLLFHSQTGEELWKLVMDLVCLFQMREYDECWME